MTDADPAIEHKAQEMIARYGRVNAAILADKAVNTARLTGMRKVAEQMELVAAAIRAA